MSTKNHDEIRTLRKSLKYRDVSRIAKALDLTPEYVSACLSERSRKQSERVEEAAWKLVTERMFTKQTLLQKHKSLTPQP